MKHRLDGLDLTWSPDGTQIITSGSTVYFREVYLWNVPTGEHTAILTDETNVTWHPNGHLLAGLGSGLVIWDASLLEPLSTLPSGSLYALEWSTDGRFLASGDSRYWIQIYELH
jgi:WD40 repeat protein